MSPPHIGRPARDQPAAGRGDLDAIVADERGEVRLLAREIDEREAERAFAGARGPADDDARLTYDQRARMQPDRPGRVRAHEAAGSEMMKRAPAPWRIVSPSCAASPGGASPSPASARSGAVASAGRFCAQMRPPCASTIWREIERAEPGILPKALIGPIGVEALKNALERMFGNARPVVLDGDEDALARVLEIFVAGDRDAAQRDAYPRRPARRRSGRSR